MNLKEWTGAFCLTALLSVGCSSTGRGPAPTTGEPVAVASDSYLDRKAREIQRLERRVNDLDTLAADPRRKYQGSHESLQALVHQQNRLLLSAKEDLSLLENRADRDANTRMLKLNDTLDEMRTTLNLMVAE